MTRTLNPQHRHKLRVERTREALATADAVHTWETHKLLKGRAIDALPEQELKNLLNYLHNANQR